MPDPVTFALTWAARVAADVKKTPEEERKFEDDLQKTGKWAK